MKNPIEEAIELLLQEIDSEIAQTQTYAEKALKEKKFTQVETYIQQIQQLENFHQKVKLLLQDWKQLHPSPPPAKSNQTPVKRLSKGKATPQNAYRRAILESLVELGGAAKVQNVLNKVEQKMKSNLNSYDYQPLPCSGEIRWRNRAMWCRLHLVREGLLHPNSPHGIWEISKKGRKALENGSI